MVSTVISALNDLSKRADILFKEEDFFIDIRTVYEYNRNVSSVHGGIYVLEGEPN